MLNLLKVPSPIYKYLIEAQSGNIQIACTNLVSTRFKSDKQSSGGKGEKGGKKEKKMCGSVKGGKDEKSKGSAKEGKGDKGKSGKEQCSGVKSKDEEKKGGSKESDGGELSDFPRIGINGFGRIGRNAMRIAVEYGCPLEIVAINDPGMTPDYMAWMLKYDSIHGRFPSDVELDGSKLLIDGRSVCTYQEADPKNIPWKDLKVDYVIESSGKFRTAEKVKGHLDAGAKHVVVTAPCKDDSPTFVVGVNLEDYDPSMQVVSAASCATNALAPLCKVLHENFEIEEGLMSTVHAATVSQKVLDAASPKNWRESRGVLYNIIPTYTGASEALARVLPELEGKMTAISIRVPVQNVSLIDLSVRLKKETCLDEIKSALEESIDEGSMLGIIEVFNEDAVSSDFNGSHYSIIFDSKGSLGLNKHFFKLLGWYDNEYGYTCRVIDLIKYMHADALEKRESST